MLAKLFSRSRPAQTARAPEGRRLYAIGDIHGRLDLLDGLLARIRADEAARGGAEGALIFLGDLVDRGPQSAQVIDRLIALKAERPGTRLLLGNHEEVFLAALGGERKALRFFTRIGGAETILSYGVAPDRYAKADFDELAQLLEDAVPPAHRAFLESFDDLIVEGDYVFVHAGVRPGVPLEEQALRDLRWIRDEFVGVRERAVHDKVVVYGHTIGEDVVERPGRIGLDTGAYQSGVLTAMGFEAGERWVLQQRGTAAAAAA